MISTRALYQIDPCSLKLTKPFSSLKVNNIIDNFIQHKAPGHDPIIAQILAELTKKGTINAILLLQYFPYTGNNMVPKLLLPCISKIFLRFFYSGLLLIVNKLDILLNYQFGFHIKHTMPSILLELSSKVRNSVQAL